MLSFDLLKKIGFDTGDIPYILNCHAKYGPKLAPLAERYAATFGTSELAPYPGEEREKAYTRAKDYVAAAIALFPEEENPHILNLLSWLQLIPYLQGRYEAHSLPKDMLYASLSDLPEKARECRSVYEVCGVFSKWFFLFFELKVFPLGRLDYEIAAFDADSFSRGGITLNRGDTVYSCHIPAKGKLTEEACLDSLQRAYEFFKPDLSGNILPVVCHSWLLYPPYHKQVFPRDSNLSRFSEMFDILYAESTGQTFGDCWRVFGKMYAGNTQNFPADTQLRRNFLRYMENGNDFGAGFGLLLYDGEKKQLL